MVVGFQILGKNLGNIRDSLGWELILELEHVVEEIADVLNHLPCVDVVFTRISFLVAADIENCLEVRAVFEYRREFWCEFLGPAFQEVVQVGRRNLQQNVLAHVVQFVQVEERTGVAHLLGRELELVDISIWISDSPLLEVRIQNRQQVLANCRWVISFISIVVERKLWVFSLGKLALVAVLADLHKLSRVAVNRHVPAELFEQLYVNRQRRNPFSTAYYVRRAHQVIVHNVREVICRNSSSLEDYRILVVYRHVEGAANRVLNLEALDLILWQAHVAVGLETDNVRLASCEIRLDFFHSEVSARSPLAVDARVCLLGFLFCVDVGNLFLRQEARICVSLGNELFRKALVDFASVALRVVAVLADIAGHSRALVEVDSEELERFDDYFNRAFDIALVIGILDSQEKLAARLVRESLVYECAVQVAKMYEPCRTRTEPRDLRTRRQIARRIHFLVVLWGFRDMRE